MVTLKDIANEVDISVAAVSLALRDHPSISVETKRRVWEVRERLGYRKPLRPPASIFSRNEEGRSGKKTRNIALVLVNRRFDDWAYMRGFQEISDKVKDRCWNVVYVTANLQDLEEGRVPESLVQQLVDGIIVSGVYNTKAHQVLRKLGIPIVVYGRYPQGGRHQMMSCEPDFEQCMELFFTHMTGLGHSRFGLYIKSTESLNTQYLYHYYLREVRTRSVVSMGEASLDTLDGFVQLEELISRRPTAIFVVTSYLTPYLYQICERQQLSIPRDISIAVYGGVNNLYLDPQPAYFLGGEHSAEIIVSKLELLMNNPDAPCTRELMPRVLVPGGSIGPAPE